MGNYCFSSGKSIIISAGILACLMILSGCKKSDDDSIPVLQLGDYYSWELITYFESNEFISKKPLLEFDNDNIILLCYKSDAGLKALTIDSMGNSSELAISGNYDEYFQSVFFSHQNIPYFCTNQRIIKYEESGSIFYYPVDSGNKDLMMASMNPADGSLWVATRYGLYSNQGGENFTLIRSHQEMFGERYDEVPSGNWEKNKKMIWHNNSLYYMLLGELWKYNEGNWLRINDVYKADNILIGDFCLDSQDIVWISVIGYNGLLKLNAANEVFPFPPIYNPSGNISDPAINTGSTVTISNLAIDQNDRIWMSLSSGGIIMYSGNSWYTLSSDEESVNSLIFAKNLIVSVDRNNNVILAHTNYLAVGRITEKGR